jgi:hypothetical protein
LAQKTLREQVIEFLDEAVLCKPEEERTRRDEQLLQYGRAFADVLLRHEQVAAPLTVHEEAVTGLLAEYNEINREYDLRNLDAETLATFRRGRR